MKDEEDRDGLDPGDLGDEELEARLPPIPPELMSVYEEGPFTKCTYCSRDLAKAPYPHTVEKIFRGTETIVEFALCLPCIQSLRRELSKESLERMDRYVKEHFPPPENGSCLGCRTPREEMTAYKLSALCGGGRLLLPEVVAICESCAEKIAETLSKKTRDRLDDFRRDVLDLFPDGLTIDPIVV